MSDQAQLEDDLQAYFRQRGRAYVRSLLTSAEYARYEQIIDNPDRVPPQNPSRSIYSHHHVVGNRGRKPTQARQDSQ